MEKQMRAMCAVMVAVLVCAVFAGCGGEQKGQDAKKSQQAASFRIVTSFYPMYVATINVADGIEGVTVTNMTRPQTGCLHDYQMTPADRKALEGANAFVVNGAGMERFLDKAVAAEKNLTVVDASQGIALLRHDGEENPHVWLSVPAAVQQVQNIADGLGKADPAHAAQYQKNAEKYMATLTALDRELHEALDGVAHQEIVTFHEAFPYFAQAYGLRIVRVIAREPGTEPTPAELAQTIAEVKALPHAALFAEPQYSTRAAETIARETGLTLFTLDPIVTGDATPAAKDDYVKKMRENAATLKKALE